MAVCDCVRYDLSHLMGFTPFNPPSSHCSHLRLHNLVVDFTGFLTLIMANGLFTFLLVHTTLIFGQVIIQCSVLELLNYLLYPHAFKNLNLIGQDTVM